MASPEACPSPTIVLSKTGRRKLGIFRDRLLRNAEASLSAGMGSRLPFLKKMLCGQDVPDAESSRIQLPAWLMRLSSGNAFRLDLEECTTEGFDAFYKRVGAFNSSKAYSGCQAFPESLNPAEIGRYDLYLVVPSETRFIGDLKITWPVSGAAASARPGSAQVGGNFIVPLFQVFFPDDPSHGIMGAIALAHETEHALHGSLPYPRGSMLDRLPEESERLAILKTISELGDLSSFLVDSMYPGTNSPFFRAARSLRRTFERRYNISGQEMDFAVECWRSRDDKLSHAFPNGIPWNKIMAVGRQFGLCQEKDACQKVANAAAAEYERRYERNFRMPLAVIREIVSAVEL